jgi:hypothetical protein
MNQEQHRLETEAREWLNAGYTTKSLVKSLSGKIAKHRGQATADQLISEMARQKRGLA